MRMNSKATCGSRWTKRSAIVLGIGCACAATAQPIHNATNGNYYARVDGSVTWSAARAGAEGSVYAERRGHLLTITSAAENDWVRNNLGGGAALDRHWIGGTKIPGRPGPFGGFAWTTGENFTYSNWTQGEPNNSGGHEDAIEFWVGNCSWNDNRADAAELGYVVEYEKYEGEPFRFVTSDYLGTSITRPGLYDLQPTVLFEPDAPDGRRFKMWWLGQFRAGDTDLPPSALEAGDRIYYAWSTDGQSWAAPQVVLKGRGGQSGSDAADDHLVGSPSVLKINGTYYMFYEAYATWITVINRFFSPARGDTWCTNGSPQFASSADYPTPCGSGAMRPDFDPSYSFERSLGFAPFLVKAGAHPVYAGESTYPNGKINRYLSARPPLSVTCGPGPEGPGRWRALNGGAPVFWLYDNPAPGRVPLFACFDGQFSNSYATLDSNCEGHGSRDGFHGMLNREAGLLGYVCDSLSAPDMVGANQNRVCLATSTDGVNWTRVLGAARGGAMIVPQNEITNVYPHSCGQAIPSELYDVHRAYGSGFPCAIVRDEFLELYFSDDSVFNIQDCSHPLLSWRIRIPAAQILNPSAYASAVRQPHAFYGQDMKWSRLYKRYFALAPKVEGPQGACDSQRRRSPMVLWSQFNPDPSAPAGFAFDDLTQFDALFPTNAGNTNAGRIGDWGGILGDGNGNTVDFFGPGLSYSALHLFYSAQTPSVCDSVFEVDLDHVLVLAYPADRDLDWFADWLDICPAAYNPDQADHDGDGLGDACEPVFAGDVNCDRAINNFDIDGFVLALSDAAAYWAVYPSCNVLNADANHDGLINNFDIDAFVICLVNGACP